MAETAVMGRALRMVRVGVFYVKGQSQKSPQRQKKPEPPEKGIHVFKSPGLQSTKIGIAASTASRQLSGHEK